jgi:hypothetical protein
MKTSIARLIWGRAELHQHEEKTTAMLRPELGRGQPELTRVRQELLPEKPPI